MADLQIQNPSITSGAFASMLAFSSDNYTITAISGHPIAGVGGGGTPVDGYWRPSVNADGVISWAWSLESTSTVPSTANIKGSQGIQGETGPQGPSGTNGKDAPIPEFQINSSNAHWEWKYTNESDWTDLNVVASGAVGPQGPSGAKGKDGAKGDKGDDATPLTATTATIAGGTQVTISYTSGGDPLAQFNVLSGAQGASGQNGKNGTNGFSPTVSTATTATVDRTGTVLTFTHGDEGEQTTSYTAWNGVDGQGATVKLLEGNGIQITHEAETTNYTISVSADYMTAVSADSTLSGDGTSEHPLGIDMSSAYSIDGAHGITAIPNTADNKVIVQMTDDVWAYYQRLAASANVWDSASAIGNKSKTVINNSVNTITTENNGTSATLSAVEYKVNTSFQNAAPKQLFVVQDDNDIYSKLSEVNGKGSLFFVCSAI